MFLLALFLPLFLPILLAADDVTTPPPRILPADSESGPKAYGIDLYKCNDAMCWTGDSCGFGHPSGKLKVFNGTDTVTCRNAIYVRRHTEFSIAVEIMWEGTDISISIRPKNKNGVVEGTDFFVCSSQRGQKSVVTTSNSEFHISEQPEPMNLRYDDERAADGKSSVTYCKFHLKTRSRIGNFLVEMQIRQLCVFLKKEAETALEQECLIMRRNDVYYNTFNRPKEFKEATQKMYTVFLIAYSMLLAIIAYPMYCAWAESLVNFRLMRAYFRFRKTLIELPEEDLRGHASKYPNAATSDIDGNGSNFGPGSTERL